MAVPTFGSSGIVMPLDVAGEQYNDVSVFTQQYYPNQTPLMARAARVKVGTDTFEIRHKGKRPVSYVLGATPNATDTFSTVSVTPQVPAVGLQIGDDSVLMRGDVLSFGGESLLVVATSNTEIAALPSIAAMGQTIPTPGNILVMRGAEGTTKATTASGTATLVTNARTGGEIFQSAYRTKPIRVFQNVQTWQFPVQVSGKAQSSNIIGVPDLFAQDKLEKLDDMMRIMEYGGLYSIGQAEGTNLQNANPAAIANPLNPVAIQMGIRQQISYNRKTATSPGNYLPANFIADLLAPPRAVSGEVNFVMMSTDFMSGIDGWGTHLERLQVGQSVFGVDIKSFTSSLAGGTVEFIENIYLKSGTAFSGRWENVIWREKRPEQWVPRGNRGDAIEGEWLSEGAWEIQDQEKFAWVEGVTQFGVPS